MTDRDPRPCSSGPATARCTRPRSSTRRTFARRESTGAEPAYRMFDEQGNVLVLRSDMTIPIARLVATRYAHAEPPLRFCYFAHAYRGVRPQRGQSREFLQAGVELIGAPGARGDRRGARRSSCARSTPPGSRPTASGSATPRCTRRCSRRWTSRPTSTSVILTELATGDFVGVEREIHRARARLELTPSCCCACRGSAAAPRCWRGSTAPPARAP